MPAYDRTMSRPRTRFLVVLTVLSMALAVGAPMPVIGPIQTDAASTAMAADGSMPGCERCPNEPRPPTCNAVCGVVLAMLPADALARFRVPATFVATAAAKFHGAIARPDPPPPKRA